MTSIYQQSRPVIHFVEYVFLSWLEVIMEPLLRED
jgi:hypothetical protein